MGGKQVPTGVVVAVVAVVVLLLGIFLYKGATGGVQGDGKDRAASQPGSDAGNRGGKAAPSGP